MYRFNSSKFIMNPGIGPEYEFRQNIENTHTNIQYIMYESGYPVYTFSNSNVAFDYLKSLCESRLKYFANKPFFTKLRNDPCEDVGLCMFVFTDSGECTDYAVYKYNDITNTFTCQRLGVPGHR